MEGLEVVIQSQWSRQLRESGAPISHVFGIGLGCRRPLSHSTTVLRWGDDLRMSDYQNHESAVKIGESS
jgi:hypothetical protein